MSNNFFEQQFLTEQKNKLEKEKERLEKELARHGRRGTGGKDYQAKYENLGDDEESNAAEYVLAEANIDLVENLEAELRRVQAALGRLQRGDYGIDQKTGKPINRRRLEIYPAAESDV